MEIRDLLLLSDGRKSIEKSDLGQLDSLNWILDASHIENCLKI